MPRPRNIVSDMHRMLDWSRMEFANTANAAAPRGVTEREFPCCPSLASTVFYDGSVAKDRLSSDLFGWADVDLISPADSGEKSTCEWPLSYLCEIVAVDGRDAAAPPAASSPRLLKSPI